MKNLFIIFTLIFPPVVFGYIDCQDDSITEAATELSIPNCYRLELFESAKKGLKSNLCEKCKTKFEKLSTKKIPSYTSDEKRKEFLNAAFNEYKKVVVSNLIDVTKIRATNSTNSDFSASIKSCRLKTLNDFKSECKSPLAIDLVEKGNFFQDISKQTRTELAKILSDDANYKPSNTLLDRNQRSCFIKEQDVLTLMNTTLEEAFSPELIQRIKKLDAKEFTNLDELAISLDEVHSNASDLMTLIKSHPLLLQKFKDPTSFINFFKSVEAPETNKSLRMKLYDKDTGNNFDKKLAQSCDDSFKKLQESLCSDDFKNGSLKMKPFENFNKLNENGFQNDEVSYSTNEKQIENNLSILKYCDANADTGKRDITSDLNSIAKTIIPEYQRLPIKVFKLEKYENEIGKMTTFLCTTDLNSCKDKVSFNCQVLQKYKHHTTHPTSLDAKIASSSNKEVNNLLRSMIGDSTDIDSATKTILVNNGIIPRNDGTLVPQVEIPERKSENYAEAIKSTSDKKDRIVNTTQSLSRKSSDNREERSQYDDLTGLSSPSPSSSALNDNSADLRNTIKDQEREFKDVQDEIRRRLSGLPNQKPTSMAEARKIASESFASRGRKYSPDEVTSFAEQMMAPQADRAASPTAQAFSGSSSVDRATVSGGKSRAEQLREAQKNQALMGMAGAQQSALNDSKGATSAEAAKAKDLAKVNLNIAEDPKVTLSDFFAQKMQLNDGETQKLKELLKQNNNFVLQVKDMNFKVLFDEKNAFNLLLESGDKREAERIRPQLEIFLNKLKRNNTLHNLNQTWST